MAHYTAHDVDIETEWNLKDAFDVKICFVKLVDIETEWNLKNFIQDAKFQDTLVDIETEWNLKFAKNFTWTGGA